MIDAREVQWIKSDGSKVEIGASLPAATYWIELPCDAGPHSVQVRYDDALAASGGIVQASNQQIGNAYDTEAGLWSPTAYTMAAIVAGSVGSAIILLPDLLVGRRRFAFTVTTPGVGRVFIR